MKINVNDREYTFTDSQQWLDNDTYCVMARHDGEEYCLSYDAPDVDSDELDDLGIDSAEFIDWEAPALINRVMDGAAVCRG